MKSALLALLAILIAGSMLSAQGNDAAERPFLAVPYSTKAPVIDGKITAGEWDLSAGVYGFIAENGNIFNKPAAARMVWDDSGIYVCVTTAQNSLRAENSPLSTDALVSSDDAVEVFLQPDENAYYHFITNSIGAKYDARGTDASWNSSWQSASSIDKEQWTVEMFIPYANGLTKPEPGAEWKFNLCRDFKDPNGWTSLAPMGGSFHNPSGFATLQFAKDTLGVSVVDSDLPGPAESKLRLKVYSPVADTIHVKWKATIADTGQGLGSGEGSLSVSPNAGRDFEISLVSPVPPIAGKTHTLELAITTEKGLILQKRTINFVPADDVAFKITYDPKAKTLKLDLDIAKLLNKPGNKLTASASLCDMSGRELRTGAAVKVDNDSTQLTLDISGVPDGKYEVVAKVFSADGKSAGTKQATFSIYNAPDWKNNRIGSDDNVPPPWTPLKLTGNNIVCWNRVYGLGNNGLPATIKSGSRNLLSGPVLLNSVVNGKKVTAKPVSSKVIAKSKSTVVMLKQQTGENISIYTKTTCEFDGMLRFDITLKPKKAGVQIDRLALNIPIPAAVAKYHYNYAYTFGGGKGAIQPTDPNMIGKLEVPWSSDFNPGMWIGNASTGISWFAEGKRNWNQKVSGKALEAVRQGNSVVLKVNFVDTPVALTKPVTITFGIQATPAKPFPRPKDWLTYRPVEMVGNKLFFCGWGGDTRWQGFPIIGNHRAKPGDANEFDDTAFVENQKKLRARGLLLPMYLNPATAATDMPELVYYRNQWKNTPDIITGTDTGQEIILVCAADKNWQDLYIKRLQEFMDKYDVDATYMDWAFCQRCANAEHGCGYTNPDGTREGTWPVFALHELHKRIYKVMKAAKPKSPLVTLAHPVGSMCLPHTNFWDAYVEGEYINVDIRGPKYAGEYTAFYTPKRFTAEYNGRNWGSVPLFMAYVSEPARSRTVFALALMTGAIVWPAYLDWNTQVSVWNALDKFGVDRIEEFLPYWDNKGAVKCSGTEKVFATTYCNKGKALLAVSNLGADAVSVNITLNQKALKTAGLTVTDAENGSMLSENKSNLKIDIPAKDFKLLAVE